MDVLTIVLIIIALAAVALAGIMAGKARAAETLRRKAEDEGAKAAEKYEVEISASKQEYQAAMESQKSEFQESLDSQKQEMQSRFDSQKQELQRSFETQKKELQDRFDNQKQELQSSFETQKKELQDNFEARLKTQQENYEGSLKSQKESYENSLKTQKDNYENSLKTLQENFEERLRTQQENFDNSQRMMKENMSQQLEQQKLAFDKLSKDHLAAQQEDMKKTNAESLENLLNPLKDSIADFREKFQKGLEERGEKEASMKTMIEELNKTATGLGKDAESLAKALRSESKTQGNWGEGVLSNILSNSGLREGIDYFVQQAETADDNSRLIADVVVKMRDGVLLIDSKTSLTAYTEYCNAESETERASALKNHLKSVRDHVDELSKKDYTGSFSGSPDYILMFIPVEGSYVLAVDNDPELITYAYGKKVLICNPSTLLMTLRIVFLFWQSDKQTKNVSAMIKDMTSIYEKFAGFTESFETVGAQLQTVQRSYDKAKVQLVSGKGNLVGQMRKLTAKGLTPKKDVPRNMIDEAEASDEAKTSAGAELQKGAATQAGANAVKAAKENP